MKNHGKEIIEERKLQRRAERADVVINIILSVFLVVISALVLSGIILSI